MGERVIVCGGRAYTDRDVVFEYLDFRHGETPFSLVMHGGAQGADTLAGQWAQQRGIREAVFPADWGLHGKAAGVFRNQRMLDEGGPTMVIAFPGGRGTADMVRRALKAGLPVWKPIPNPLLGSRPSEQREG